MSSFETMNQRVSFLILTFFLNFHYINLINWIFIIITKFLTLKRILSNRIYVYKNYIQTVLIFVVIPFCPLCHPAFFRYFFNLGTLQEISHWALYIVHILLSMSRDILPSSYLIITCPVSTVSVKCLHVPYQELKSQLMDYQIHEPILIHWNKLPPTACSLRLILLVAVAIIFDCFSFLIAAVVETLLSFLFINDSHMVFISLLGLLRTSL